MAAGYTIETDDEGRWLVVTGDWTEKTARVMKRKKIDGLTLNYARGFRERALDLLVGLPLRRLRILARTHTDLEPIYSLNGTLESLDLTVGNASRLDLTRLPRLRSLSAEWRQVADSIATATLLDDLYLGSYDEKDFSVLSTLGKLQRLNMKDRPYVESLDGLAAFPNLRWLEIAGAQRLADFDALAVEAPHLEHLSLNSCKRLDRLDMLAGLTALTMLHLGNCGSIESLHPIRDLRQLRMLLLYESTRITDDDLSVLLDLPHLEVLGMRSRRSYVPSVEVIQRAITSRQGARS